MQVSGQTLHDTPKNIAGAVESAIREHRPQFDHIYVAYGDCGTGGKLDAVLSKWGVERLPGAHCYDFFARPDHLAALAEQEPGTFYLTDFLTRHFERLVIRGLGLDRHPELRDEYFAIRQMAMTARLCDEAKNALEQQVRTVLGQESVITVDENKVLTLEVPGTVLEFVLKDWVR